MQLAQRHHPTGVLHQYLQDRCFPNREVHDEALHQHSTPGDIESHWAHDQRCPPTGKLSTGRCAPPARFLAHTSHLKHRSPDKAEGPREIPRTTRMKRDGNSWRKSVTLLIPVTLAERSTLWSVGFAVVSGEMTSCDRWDRL